MWQVAVATLEQIHNTTYSYILIQTGTERISKVLMRQRSSTLGLMVALAGEAKYCTSVLMTFPRW